MDHSQKVRKEGKKLRGPHPVNGLPQKTGEPCRKCVQQLIPDIKG